jgi:hypothetical protein
MMSKIGNFIFKKKILVILFVLLALFASIQSLKSGSKTFLEGGLQYTHYNNYVIFEKSFQHLTENKDLYIAYPEEQWDLFKYTPTFAAFFGIFAIFPDWLGLSLWNLFNALILLFAVYYLPKFTLQQKSIILLISLVELMTSMQNSQSNALIAGLLILTFGLLEKDKFILATLCVLFSVFIKLFGIVGFALFLFYPQKWKLTLYTVLWTILLLSIPLIFISIGQYKFLFTSFGKMLSHDHAASYGYSVMGWLNSWFGIMVNKLYVVLAGAFVFLIPFLKIKNFKYFMFRILTLASILIWIVIFNHKAESPTFIIAMAGVSLWFVASPKNYVNIVLFILAFLFTSLSPTDIFPRFVREEYVNPYCLKVFPCILIWFKITYDLITFKEEKNDEIVKINGAALDSH